MPRKDSTLQRKGSSCRAKSRVWKVPFQFSEKRKKERVTQPAREKGTSRKGEFECELRGKAIVDSRPG